MISVLLYPGVVSNKRDAKSERRGTVVLVQRIALPSSSLRATESAWRVVPDPSSVVTFPLAMESVVLQVILGAYRVERKDSVSEAVDERTVAAGMAQVGGEATQIWYSHNTWSLFSTTIGTLAPGSPCRGSVSAVIGPC